jgi:hypothetical protein
MIGDNYVLPCYKGSMGVLHVVEDVAGISNGAHLCCRRANRGVCELALQTPEPTLRFAQNITVVLQLGPVNNAQRIIR